MKSDLPPWFTTEQVADVLALTEPDVRRMLKSGDLTRTWHRSTRWRVTRASLLSFLDTLKGSRRVWAHRRLEALEGRIREGIEGVPSQRPARKGGAV